MFLLHKINLIPILKFFLCVLSNSGLLFLWIGLNKKLDLIQLYLSINRDLPLRIWYRTFRKRIKLRSWNSTSWKLVGVLNERLYNIEHPLRMHVCLKRKRKKSKFWALKVDSCLLDANVHLWVRKQEIFERANLGLGLFNWKMFWFWFLSIRPNVSQNLYQKLKLGLNALIPLIKQLHRKQELCKIAPLYLENIERFWKKVILTKNTSFKWQ